MGAFIELHPDLANHGFDACMLDTCRCRKRDNQARFGFLIGNIFVVAELSASLGKFELDEKINDCGMGRHPFNPLILMGSKLLGPHSQFQQNNFSRKTCRRAFPRSRVSI